MPVAELDPIVTTEDDEVITECYIVGDGDDIVTADTFLQDVVKNVTMGKFSDDEVIKESMLSMDDVSKSVEGSRQQEVVRQGKPLKELKIVEPPYPPEFLTLFLKADETNFRCIAAKALDTAGRPWNIKIASKLEITPDKYDEEDVTTVPIEAKEQLATAKSFLSSCNTQLGLEGVMYKAAMDHESVGWAAIEVVRSLDGKVKALDHIPVDRIKPLEGWGGFVESTPSGGKIYYQGFGKKLLSATRVNPVTKEKEYYSPELDGDLAPGNFEFNLIDWKTGDPTSNFLNSANEIIWVPKHHPATIYYGVTDTVPILSKILANINISQYLLQFFEHNTIPRYVVIIKGAKVDQEVKNTILNYFRTEVRGRAHKTLVIPIPGGKGGIEVEFIKLDTENDGWFRESSKDNALAIRVSHGVPGAVIGVDENASLGSGKGISAGETYKDRIVVPGQSRWAGEINDLLKLGLGLTLVEFFYTEIDTRDSEAKMRVLTAFQDRGVLTINQVRHMMNYGGPIKGGDRAFVKVGNAIVFIDEIPEMKSGPLVPDQPPGAGKIGLSKGGDMRVNTPPRNEPTNGPQNIASGKSMKK